MHGFLDQIVHMLTLCVQMWFSLSINFCMSINVKSVYSQPERYNIARYHLRCSTNVLKGSDRKKKKREGKLSPLEVFCLGLESLTHRSKFLLEVEIAKTCLKIRISDR